MWAKWQSRARQLKTGTYALYIAGRDPRVAWYVRLLAGLVVAYAFSPIDLIPDFIPVLGYLDDLLLVPLGIWLVMRLIPAEVLVSAREQAKAAHDAGHLSSRMGAAIVLGIWGLAAVLLAAAFLCR